METFATNKVSIVFVDNVKKPLTACIYDCQHNFYIVGNVDNMEFNEALKEYMLDNIFPSKRVSDTLDFYIHSDPVELWEKELTNLKELYRV